MPNYKITYPVQREIRDRAKDLSQRTLDYAQADFPLTVATIQNLVLPESQVADLRRLYAEGIRTIEKHEMIRLAFLREILPGIPRGLVVACHLPERIFVARATQWGMQTTKFSMDEGGYLVPDLTKLDPGETKNLANWVNRVVRAKRLKELTDTTVEIIVDKYIPTTSHMHALWPGLASLARTADTYGGRGISWKDRVRHQTRSLKKYQPEPEVIQRYGKRIQAADTVLTQGDMLETYKHPPKTIRAIAEQHEALATDPVWDVE